MFMCGQTARQTSTNDARTTSFGYPRCMLDMESKLFTGLVPPPSSKGCTTRLARLPSGLSSEFSVLPIFKYMLCHNDTVFVLYYFCRLKFYMALHRHLKLEKMYETIQEKYLKPQMGASRYMLFYLASSAADAALRDPTHVAMVLDRSAMWNCTQLKVCIITI
jgi:hypothetical protein